jgi:hypothetical protein
MHDILVNASGLTVSVLGIWFVFWAQRRSNELDLELDRTMRAVRWSIVLAGFAAALLSGTRFRALRIVGGVMLLAFLCWPNYAYHLVRAWRRFVLRTKI